ncbi:FRG domain-containing protein [Panacibacter ginsenosidivorans]|uniref:FRG domain-containing protein n=1 Tax=Panacibacter ginsenosidivorans TaxID=1813871 RepID=A0A5B8VDF5_9BACT|nr:FRG domain-containing protein [Panacibacter ginsenosidivorans]QEC68308.1 FRG domain-containing protein [Panacibacter ginsenosidivorans]
MTEITTLGEYINEVNKIQTRWTKEENGEFIFPWFRGHANEAYHLMPSLYREKGLHENEDSYRHDFQQKGFPYLSDTTFGVPVADWEWYFLMQHYGLPTRLLDWTEGSLIALYFALFYKAKEDESNPCVWMLNPFALNRMLHRNEAIFLFTDKQVDDYLPAIWSGKNLPVHPIAFQPAFKSKRIAAQKGCFTIHGANQEPLDKTGTLDSCLKKIVIKYYNINLIKGELIVAGITESSLFPELSGLARELVEYYKK